MNKYVFLSTQYLVIIIIVYIIVSEYWIIVWLNWSVHLSWIMRHISYQINYITTNCTEEPKNEIWQGENLIICWVALTVWEYSRWSYFNRWQRTYMIEHSTSISHRLSQMHKCSNVYSFRCVSNSRTNGHSHIICAVLMKKMKMKIKIKIKMKMRISMFILRWIEKQTEKKKTKKGRSLLWWFRFLCFISCKYWLSQNI